VSKKADAPAEWVSPDTLKPWPGNPRRNDGKPVEAVAKSIERFGFAAPIVARREDGEIIAGHTRWKAAQKLGLTKVPVRFMDLGDREAHLLALADNRQTELTPWDEPMLAEALSDFGLEDAELAGWDSEALGALADAVPDFGPLDKGAEWPSLPDGDEPEMGQVAFYLNAEQRALVERAIGSVDVSGEDGRRRSLALVAICERCLGIGS
jgi:site-specific DNA-methyltransferase (adenine-specific)